LKYELFVRFVCGCLNTRIYNIVRDVLPSTHVYATDFYIFIFLHVCTFITCWSPLSPDVYSWQLVAPHSGNDGMSISVRCRHSFGMG
jgi:hypothetical protein